MIIIILLGIYMINAFRIPKIHKVRDISLYPTVGEFYQYQLESFINQTQQMCKIVPQVPNVQLINQCEEICSIKGYQFKSMSSNNTHFGTLTNDNQVIIYEWKNQMIQQIGQSMSIDSSFNCFNINLSFDFSILVDCYYNNEFFIIQITNEQSIIAYQIQSFQPTKTKIQSIINGTNAFIVYAQYFNNYSILSLLSSSFQNLSSLNNQFVDFDCTTTISPNIYAITSQVIFQLSISPDAQFQQKTNFTTFDFHYFNTISVYYNLWTYSQCDQILLSFKQPYRGQCSSLLGCDNKIVVAETARYLQNKPVLQMFQNNQFLIYQFSDTIFIYEQLAGEFYTFQLNQSNNSLLYLNYNNELFSFNQDIIVYKIQTTSLQVNLTNVQNAGNNYTFSLQCLIVHSLYNQPTYTYTNFFLQVLPKNNTNIYVMFNQYMGGHIISYNLLDTNFFLSFSGQLLQYKLNPNGIHLNCTLLTGQKVGDLSYSYQLVSFMEADYYFNNLQYLIGYGNQSLNVLTGSLNGESFQITLLSSIYVSINATSLKVGVSIYPKMFIIGLSNNDTIYLFQYLFQNQSIISYSNNTFKQQLSDFIVTYNSIIILTLNKEIQILTFNFTNIFTLNQQSIDKFFKNIQFYPIQIIMNTQISSSLLYINNINEVLIISIDQNSFPIPINLIQVNFQIKQINLVSYQLILSYLCNNQQNICFQLWYVQYLPKFYFVKNLYSVNFDNNIIIQSDNLFFYVTFSNYTLYIYNPLLPYHMSLYYMLELTSPIQFALAVQSSYFYMPLFQYKNSMILLKDNSIYYIHRVQQYQISEEVQNENFNNSRTYPSFVYNFSVTSVLNDTALYQTPNQSVTLFTNFTVFQNLTYIPQINLSKDNIIPHTKYFTYQMNLILNRQVAQCNLTQNYDYNEYCSLSQFQVQPSIIVNDNYSIITQINNQYFALQNNKYIQTINSDLINLFNFSYSYLNFNDCLQSTSYIYQLYSICQNDTAQYLFNITLNVQGRIVNNSITQLPQTFINITKIRSVLNQIFILGELYKGDQYLYWLNQTNNTLQSISNEKVANIDFSAYCNDFSIVQIPQNIIIIFQVISGASNFLIYKTMLIDDQAIKLQGDIEVILAVQPVSVLILQVYSSSAIILLNDGEGCYIIQIKLEHQNTKYQQNAFIIATIPNYGNYNNTGNSFYNNEVLMQQFADNSSYYVIGVYYLNTLFALDLREPILMQYSFNTTNIIYAMIIDQQYKNGTTLSIYNQTIQKYTISTSNLTCFLKGNLQQDFNVSIFCQNAFSNGTYLITFNPPYIEKTRRRWIFVLSTIIGLLLFYFFYKVKQSTKHLKYYSNQIEL